MGGALIAGWLGEGVLTPADLMIRDPQPGPAAKAAIDAGAAPNPDDNQLARAATVVFAIKPQGWREVAANLAPRLGPEAAIVSAIAGVAAADLAVAFDGRPVARVMPTLGAAIGRGSIALWSADAGLGDDIAALFRPLGAVTSLADETLMHAATAASGSAPAYFYAFTEALEAAAGPRRSWRRRRGAHGARHLGRRRRSTGGQRRGSGRVAPSGHLARRDHGSGARGSASRLGSAGGPRGRRAAVARSKELGE